MKAFKKILISMSLVGILITQSGCVVGLATGIVGLTIPGAVIAGATGIYGYKMFQTCKVQPAACLVGGFFVAIGGMISFVLDDKNPGRLDALNPLPITPELARVLRTDTDTLEKYNENLSRVHILNTRLEGTLRAVADKRVGAEDLDKVSRKLGLADSQELVQTLGGQKLERPVLHKFALSQKMDEEVTRIYLALRWGIQTN